MKTTTFEKLRDKMHSNEIDLCHFNNLDYEIQKWIKGLCEIIDEEKLIEPTIKKDSFSSMLMHL